MIRIGKHEHGRLHPRIQQESAGRVEFRRSVSERTTVGNSRYRGVNGLSRQHRIGLRIGEFLRRFLIEINRNDRYSVSRTNRKNPRSKYLASESGAKRLHFHCSVSATVNLRSLSQGMRNEFKHIRKRTEKT